MTTFPTIEVTAPNRIDLAGGTLDVYPLYLFEDGGITLNIAINISSHARIAPRDDGRVVFESEDLDEREIYDTLDAVRTDGPLALVARAVRYYGLPCGATITVRNEAPRGSGLGASSALLMALSAGLLHAQGVQGSHTEIIDIGANLEAQVIAIPTGKQDYYPALFGGVAALTFDERGHNRRALCPSEMARDYLTSRLVLSFTGVSHFSGATNWDMLRNYIEGQAATRQSLRRIKRTAERMWRCLEAETWADLPPLLREEWENRRELAPGVTTPHIDALMEAAEDAGAEGSKLCGAGGGGCMVTYVEPGHRQAVESALTAAGARVLPFTIAARGLQVREWITT